MSAGRLSELRNKRQQQHQIARGREHEIEVQPRGIDALGIEIPAGEQQNQDEHREHDDHAAANRLLDRQPGQRPNPPRRNANDVDHGVAHHLPMIREGRQRAVQQRRHEPAEDRHGRRHAHHHRQPLPQGRGSHSKNVNNIFGIDNHERLVGSGQWLVASEWLSTLVGRIVESSGYR